MPTYEYRCKSCEHQFDAVQAFTDDALTECPECGGPLRKVFGNVGITFKGSGFYKTDSRSAGSFGSAKDADKSDRDKPDKKSDAKSDSKASTSDTKSDAKPAKDKAPASTSSSGSGSGSSGSGSKKSD
jgi:putative FmdB family regulatory protein